MDDKATNVPKAKCHKVKNPCKICFQRVTHKNGLKCEGACQRWVHFQCLQYTPGRIADIKAGIIIVTCPCPDCAQPDNEPKEFLKNPPYVCPNTKCPASQLPKCTSSDCPINMGGEGAADLSEPSLSFSGPLPPCVAKEPRPFKLCQPSRTDSNRSVPDGTPDKSPLTSCKAKLIAFKDRISTSLGKLCPEKPKSPLSDSQCNDEICKTPVHGVSGSSPNQIGSNQSMTSKVQFKETGNMPAPKKSKSFAGPIKSKPPSKKKKKINKMDCPASTSDSAIDVRKGQDSLVAALDEMCKTVGRLADQIKGIMCKLDTPA